MGRHISGIVLVALAVVAALAVTASATLAADRKDGRPQGSKPGPKQEAPVAPQATYNEDLIVNGKFGINTASPQLDIHVTTVNTPAMRLAQSNAGGFTAQTWDIAGNEANFFIKDVTGGNSLPFRIRPNAPTSSLDISADGDIGMGTGSPKTPLHILGSTPQTVRIERTGAIVPNAWDIGDSGNGTFMIDSVAADGVQLRVTGEGMVRMLPRKTPPTTDVAKGAMYNDRSGALCWYSGSRWLKVVGSGSCS